MRIRKIVVLLLLFTFTVVVLCLICVSRHVTSSSETTLYYNLPDQTFPNVLTSDELIQQIRSNCRKNNLNTTWNRDKINYSHFPRRIMLQDGMAYVANPKTGSTSFRNFLRYIRGLKKEHHIPVYYGRYYEENETVLPPAQLADLLEDRFKLVFIRNPLVRVLSGFRDKVLRRGGVLSKGEKWGPEEYPANATEYEIFSWFVGKLTNYNGNQGSLGGNLHFKRQYSSMCICYFPYDFIGQVELNSRDIPLMQRLSNTTQYEFPGSRTQQGKDAESTVELANRFWGRLRPELLNSFYDHYHFDFEILGYPKLYEPNFPYITKPEL